MGALCGSQGAHAFLGAPSTAAELLPFSDFQAYFLKKNNSLRKNYYEVSKTRNPPTPLCAGRASEALAFELVTFAKSSSSHIALLGAPLFCLPGKRLRLQGHWGERFEGGFWVDFWLRFAFTAMQVCILAEFLCFGTVFDLVLFRLQERFVFDYAEARWSKMIP